MSGAKPCNVCGHHLSVHVNGKPCYLWQWIATMPRARGSHD